MTTTIDAQERELRAERELYLAHFPAYMPGYWTARQESEFAVWQAARRAPRPAAEAAGKLFNGSIGDDADFRRLIRNCEHKSMGLFEYRKAREELVTWLDTRSASKASASAAEAPDIAKLLVPTAATPAIASAIEDAIDSQLRASGIEPADMARQDGDRVSAAAIQATREGWADL
ncbi:hypothetical protein [Massilia antarctica]|uniref:hypothetical protein n=1 Tax=Massilia antarctica TaxID=2765360 RepID=UPI00226FDBF5|nr:hypothetical protein [Massilia sp. H27-R4]MCY0910914.1 hypothetical protein [Massilia sp. H27-R4]